MKRIQENIFLLSIAKNSQMFEKNKKSSQVLDIMYRKILEPPEKDIEIEKIISLSQIQSYGKYLKRGN